MLNPRTTPSGNVYFLHTTSIILLNLVLFLSSVVKSCSIFVGEATPSISKKLPFLFIPKTSHPPAVFENAETVSQELFGISDLASLTSKSSHSISSNLRISSFLFILTASQSSPHLSALIHPPLRSGPYPSVHLLPGTASPLTDQSSQTVPLSMHNCQHPHTRGFSSGSLSA